MSLRLDWRFSGVCLFAICFALWLASVARGDEKQILEEDFTDKRAFAVTLHVEVEGQLQTPTESQKAVGLKLHVDADLSYTERRLPPAGRDAQALRSVRFYDHAKAKIEAGAQTSFPSLRSTARLIVAEGQQSGVRVHSPERPLYSTELDLLQVPGDSLAALVLLPDVAIEVGDTWQLAAWAAQMFTSLEAVEKSQFTCTVDSLKDQIVRVNFQGEVTGAVYGAVTTVGVKGHFLFDVAHSYLKHLELNQSEKRSIGTVSPGLDVVAKVTLDRVAQPVPKQLDPQTLSQIPLEPNPASLLAVFDSNDWDIRIYHDRSWHLFKHEAKVAVLRLVDNGNLMAQCNITPLPSTTAGSHVPEEQFLKDIQRTLGDKFSGFESTEHIKGDDRRFVYRAVAYGKSQEVPVQWIYYLIAAPDGRQMALIFTTEKKLAKRFADRDIQIVGSLEFLQPRKEPSSTASQVDRSRRKK